MCGASCNGPRDGCQLRSFAALRMTTLWHRCMMSPSFQGALDGSGRTTGPEFFERDSIISCIQVGVRFEHRYVLKNANDRNSLAPPKIHVPHGPPCAARRLITWRTVKL